MAILVVEDDAQDGPDHVDCHRSVALVISAYNRAGALVHEFHSTVSLIRTMGLLLGFGPLNQLDASATPVDIFKAEPDLRPYKAVLPDVALDNLITPAARDAASLYWMQRTAEQDMTHADMADPRRWFDMNNHPEPSQVEKSGPGPWPYPPPPRAAVFVGGEQRPETQTAPIEMPDWFRI
jgi:hypothetical protein